MYLKSELHHRSDKCMYMHVYVDKQHQCSGATSWKCLSVFLTRVYTNIPVSNNLMCLELCAIHTTWSSSESECRIVGRHRTILLESPPARVNVFLCPPHDQSSFRGMQPSAVHVIVSSSKLQSKKIRSVVPSQEASQAPVRNGCR